MEDVIFGLFALAAGALFCFWGYLAFRMIIPVWGGFVGFTLGAGAVAGATDESFLRTGLAWLVGLTVALLFALVAYLFYEVAIIVAMGSIGFALGTGLMVALDVSWAWLIVLAGVAFGVLLAAAAIIADLPMVVLIVLSATGGATAIIGGAMLLVGALETGDFTDEAGPVRADDDWWWYLLYLALALAGIVRQARAAEELGASTRHAWAGRMARRRAA